MAVLWRWDRFEWLKARGVGHWSGVDRRTLEDYLAWLDAQDYSSFTIYFEAVTVKQAVRYFISAGLLPSTCRIDLKVLRPGTTTRYCWTEEEVVAMTVPVPPAPEEDANGH